MNESEGGGSSNRTEVRLKADCTAIPKILFIALYLPLLHFKI